MRGIHPLKSLATAALLAACSAVVVGCGHEDQDAAEVPATGLVQVEGTVTALEDQTPFDGGVTIQVTDAKRGNVTLWFESMFTNPPPRPERVALYQEIQKVSVGHTIRATAKPDGTTSYQLESI